MTPDNIIIGTPVCSEEELDILSEEETVRFNFDELRNEDGDVFLPNLLVKVGLFESTSQIRRLNKDRSTSKKIVDPNEKDLWRKLEDLEFTHFKIGRKVFWLCVGEDK